MNPRKLYYVTIGCLLGLFTGLTACRNGGTQVSYDKGLDVKKDSFVNQAITNDPEHALRLIDSLEDKQVISEHMSN